MSWPVCICGCEGLVKAGLSKGYMFVKMLFISVIVLGCDCGHIRVVRREGRGEEGGGGVLDEAADRAR